MKNANFFGHVTEVLRHESRAAFEAYDANTALKAEKTYAA
jgi:hypothetical protein